MYLALWGTKRSHTRAMSSLPTGSSWASYYTGSKASTCQLRFWRRHTKSYIDSSGMKERVWLGGTWSFENWRRAWARADVRFAILIGSCWWYYWGEKFKKSAPCWGLHWLTTVGFVWHMGLNAIANSSRGVVVNWDCSGLVPQGWWHSLLHGEIQTTD